MTLTAALMAMLRHVSSCGDMCNVVFGCGAPWALEGRDESG